MKKYAFGVDIGGTTIKIGLFETSGNLIEKWEIPTRTENKGENILPDVANAINETLNNEYHYVYDRHARRMKRDDKEIGMHSIRGGTIVGEHEVIFAGHDEVVTISHQAQSKEVFAVGAVNAAVYLADQSAGMYNMGNLLAAKLG